MTPRAWRMLAALLPGLVAATASAGEPASVTPAATFAVPAPTPATRNGREVYARFREGLADPSCGPETSQQWQRHFANAPKRLASRSDDVLPLFGYVVEALRQAQLPTEYALIPFVESGYKPGARSGSGPAGLWQFIALTARNHHVVIRPGYDGRLSPIDSTQAAVRYLKTLHGMFAGDWRLTVMAFNAGEYRVLGALKRSGQRAMDAQPETLAGLSGITQAYVRKLHALSCVLDQADDREEWLHALDRPVAILAPVTLPANAASLDAWASDRGLDAASLKRINPAFQNGRIAAGDRKLQVLAPVSAGAAFVAPTIAGARPVTLADASTASVIEAPTDKLSAPSALLRSHQVARGDSIWRVARRYGLSRDELLVRNGLTADSVLRPGMMLKIDAGSP
jgi:peptidoglycan lytic transglycosylase D